MITNDLKYNHKPVLIVLCKLLAKISTIIWYSIRTLCYNSNDAQLFLLDINECNEPSPCTDNQVCFNNAGSYLCECNLGYERDPDSGTTSPGVYLGCKGVLCTSIVSQNVCMHMYV